MFRSTVRTAVALALVAAPAVAAAQTAAPAPQPPSVEAGFQDGFFVQSSDGTYRLLFGLVAQTDAAFSLDDPSPITDTFTLRKLRPTFTGRLTRYFEFKVMPDLGGGQTRVMDAYLDVRFSPALRVRAGKDKTPVGYELLQGDAFLLFPERTLASGLVPNRDIGFQLQGDVSPRLFYAAGVFNGVPDGASSSSDSDTNSGKDAAARVVVHPFRRNATDTASALARFGFHVGGSIGKQEGGLPSFRTSVGQTYFAYAPGTQADGTRVRISPAVFYYYRAFGAFAEFMRTRQRVARAGTAMDAVNQGWEATASFVLTGEPASERGVRPRRSFDPEAGAWGALQLVTRYTEVDVDDDVFALAFGAPGAEQHARSFTIGANWYPTTFVKFYATYERTTFRRPLGSARAPENIILLRFQLGL